MKQYYKRKEMCSLEMGIKLKEIFPVLDEKYTSEELGDKLSESEIGFFEEEKVKVSFLLRMTVILAIPVYILLLMTLPINYIINGRWNYESIFLYNWFKSINLM